MTNSLNPKGRTMHKNRISDFLQDDVVARHDAPHSDLAQENFVYDPYGRGPAFDAGKADAGDTYSIVLHQCMRWDPASGSECFDTRSNARGI